LTILRDEHTSNPDAFAANIKWKYEPSTSTSGLRNHIKKYHLELYNQLCKQHNIESVIGRSTPVPVGPTTPPTREAFTNKALLQYIRNFIISDDQVSYSTFINHQRFTCFSPSMSLSVQNFGSFCSFYERISVTKIFLAVIRSEDQ
jgi:hypothetical protein